MINKIVFIFDFQYNRTKKNIAEQPKITIKILNVAYNLNKHKIYLTRFSMFELITNFNQKKKITFIISDDISYPTKCMRKVTQLSI